MNILKTLFPTPKTIETAVDGVKNGLDKLIYTEEEKADAYAKGRQWFLEFLKSTGGFNVARRWISVVVTVMWAVWTSVMGVLAILGVILKEGPIDYQGAMEALAGSYTEITTAFVVILAFYFGGQFLPTGGRAAKKAPE